MLVYQFMGRRRFTGPVKAWSDVQWWYKRRFTAALGGTGRNSSISSFVRFPNKNLVLPCQVVLTSSSAVVASKMFHWK
ncbi:hypothetical protein JTE90_001074 [Oedothorax gibbosus]|uniref:Uncharacterized protein n=1 Tax=Oedothorax gibbosus TaxID=931172 RepID=A0AAV6TP03_9ARAC|nr:hypothetical protein JTE90_001074 [Oedothorax gibbosus]